VTRIHVNSQDYMLSSIIDITERKKAEKQLQVMNQEIKIMNEKLQVMGSLARHDVRNKLSVISANAYLLKKKLGESPELLKHLEEIDNAVVQSARIFDFSKDYERIAVEKPIEVDVAACFNKAISQTSGLGAIQIKNECNGLFVIADSLLERLFYNLIDNSLKHGKKVTQIMLHCEEERGDVKIIYEDNGVGVLQENKDKIFVDGFKTGNSTGLGLKLIKEMVEAYGWTIKETGIENKGAKFVISIQTPKRALRSVMASRL